MPRLPRLLVCTFCLLPLKLLAEGPAPAPAIALRLAIDGPIGPATSDYVRRGLERAADDARLVILRIDTPGGLDLAMRDIIHDILDASVPVVTYVAPNGARAASAGTYIAYASHVAAMAPATNIGAATPVQLGGDNPLPEGEPEQDGATPGEESKPPQRSPGGDAMTHKAVNDAVAYLRGLARLRGRNAEWAEKAVREAASLEAPEALRLGVIDLIAADEEELLQALDGRIVTIQGEARTLHTRGLRVVHLEPDWRSRLLAVITEPNVAYILMIIGIYGLIFEFSNPGTIVPGVVGAICLILALFAFQALPINYAGVGLILLGIALMVGEAFNPSFGALGIGGAISFVIGSVILIDTEAPGFGIDPVLIGGLALTSAALFAFVLHLVFKARRGAIVSGREELIGATAIALEDFAARGQVRLHSEIWRARTRSPVRKGDRLRVTGLRGLEVEVESAAEKQGG